MQPNGYENSVKSTKLTDILPLITIWLQARVLPGPPTEFVALGVLVELGLNLRRTDNP
jgi:hypothetical protein